jgi:hypothetical protein
LRSYVRLAPIMRALLLLGGRGEALGL